MLRFRDDGGVTTVEWVGMALLVVLVIAFLAPEVRSTVGDIWANVTGELAGVGG